MDYDIFQTYEIASGKLPNSSTPFFSGSKIIYKSLMIQDSQFFTIINDFTVAYSENVISRNRLGSRTTFPSKPKLLH